MVADQERIYLDNAATSWPKPESVCASVDNYLRNLGAPAGRGSYHEASDVDRLIAQTRKLVAQIIQADARRIIFTFNGTDSLNLALHGLLSPDDHVITSVAEHNSVLRPLRELQQHRGVAVTYVPVDQQGIVDPDDVRNAVRPSTRLVALIHASNVTGALQPAQEIGKIARERSLTYLLDAAQTLGHVPIDVANLGVDLLAGPGHKGLLGPLGSGVLYVGERVETELRSIRQGGTGTRSENDRQPETLPDKYEAGNHNVPGLIGLGAGIQYLIERDPEDVLRHERELTARLLRHFEGTDKIQVYGPRDVEDRVGVVSLTAKGADPQDVAAMLDASCRIQVRAGLHCAPRIHNALGTLNCGGTLRISCGVFNTVEQIDFAAQAIIELVESET